MRTFLTKMSGSKLGVCTLCRKKFCYLVKVVHQIFHSKFGEENVGDYCMMKQREGNLHRQALKTWNQLKPWFEMQPHIKPWFETQPQINPWFEIQPPTKPWFEIQPQTKPWFEIQPQIKLWFEIQPQNVPSSPLGTGLQPHTLHRHCTHFVMSLSVSAAR